MKRFLNFAGEFDREKYVVLAGNFSTWKSGSRPVMIEIKGGGDWKLRPWHFPNVSLGSLQKNGEAVEGNFRLWSELNRFIITIPAGNREQAEISVSVDGETFNISLSDLCSRPSLSGMPDGA